MIRTPKRSLIAIALLSLLTLVVPTSAQARPQTYPYTLVDPGTFGGPQSYLDLPAVPLTRDGTLLGQADTSTADADYPNSNPFIGVNPYVAHAFAWRQGRLSDLGALPGNKSSAVFEVNGAGVGVGSALTTGYDPNTGWPSAHAVLFKDGHVKDLGTLPGGHQSLAGFINNRGQVTGASANGIRDPYSLFGWGTQTRSFIWQKGVMTDIGTLGGPDALSTGLNARAQIIGQSYLSSTPNPITGTPTLHPFLWQNDRMHDLGTLGGTSGSANWLNDAGDVVGNSTLTGDQELHPFLWKNGTMRDLGTLGGRFGFTTWVNDRGHVTGASQTLDGNFHGFLWRDGKMIELPTVGDAAHAAANAVNNHDQVVGGENDANFNEVMATLWIKGRGYDLNTLVAPSELRMTKAFYINDRGDIVGHGVLPDGSTRVFLLQRNPSVPLTATPSTAKTHPAAGPRDQNADAMRLAINAPNRRGAAAAFNQQLLRNNRR